MFDEWQVKRKNNEITFTKAKDINIDEKIIENEDTFLSKEFDTISLDSLGLDSAIYKFIQSRIDEIKKCFSSNAPLAVIFLAGSTLEGILLNLASKFPRHFNMAKSAPQTR